MALIVHIGAPKTATTTLQSAFFPRHPGLLFLGKQVDTERGLTGWRTPELDSLMLNLERTNLDFRPDRATVDRMVQVIKREAGNHPIVMSSEELCVFSALDSFGKLARIRELFGALGQLRVILAVRDQLSLLKSIYLTEHRGEMLHLPGTRQKWCPSFDQYLDIHFRYLCGAVIESFRFAAMIEKYEAMVGAENVLVYDFEEFKRDPVNTMRSLCRFMGIDDRDQCLESAASKRENQHRSTRDYAMSKLRQKFTGGHSVSAFIPQSLRAAFHRWLQRGTPFDFAPSPAAVRRVRDYYRADNEALFVRRGIRLKACAL